MRYLALACDYDGTLALDGQIDGSTRDALERVLASGRKLIMVTGRELRELEAICPYLHLFEWLVAENGALLYRPASREQKPLAHSPPEEFLDRLRRRGVEPLSVGRVIAATCQPHEVTVLDVIRELGIEYQIIFNKGSVMVLPAGITKATGLQAALEEMELSSHNVVGIGDAENDHAFLQFCECSAAVANALPTVKETADFATTKAAGAGVCEVIDELVGNDLKAWEGRLTRHHFVLGKAGATAVGVPPYGVNLLIAGPSGSGKSSAAASLLEILTENHYQFCIIDPEGDYANLDAVQTVGDGKHGPQLDEVLQVLRKPDINVAVNLIGLPVADRPVFFSSLLPHLLEMRARTGRPHWMLLDEAHHLFPATWEPMSATMPADFTCMVFVTVHPEHLSRSVLSRIDLLLAVGENPEQTVQEFCRASGAKVPAVPPVADGRIVCWQRGSRTALAMQVRPSRMERRRHSLKFVEGELSPANSFYFEGPAQKLHLRAQNFKIFLQVADGVDDDTWLYHLRRGDYSRWIQEQTRDAGLAREVASIEQRAAASAARSRALIKETLEKHYACGQPPSFPVPGTELADVRQAE